MRETFTIKISAAAQLIHPNLELAEGLLGGRRLQDLEGVESNSLGKRSALTNDDGITNLKLRIFKAFMKI